MVGVIVFLVVALPLLGFLLFLLLESSFVRVEPGQLGLVLVRGKPTDRALAPGRHFVPSFRRRMVQAYPSNELAYRAGGADEVEVAAESDLEHVGPALRATLGDRAVVDVGYTVRFRVQPAQLRSVHERFSPDGLWSAVRDTSSRVVRARLGVPEVGVDDLFGAARDELQEHLGHALRDALEAEGFELTMFAFGDLDLGRTGEVIQGTVRARHELEREEAESATRVARARIDADLEPYLGGAATDAALRYREIEVWRDLVQTQAERGLSAPAPPRAPASAVSVTPELEQLADEVAER
jgi:regulator of protease activity HflC (stomatin/prohibitin superfamily)